MNTTRRENRRRVRQGLDELRSMMPSNGCPGPALDRNLLTRKQRKRLGELTGRYQRTKFKNFSYPELTEMRALMNCGSGWRHPDFKTGEWVPVDPRDVSRDVAILEQINNASMPSDRRRPC